MTKSSNTFRCPVRHSNKYHLFSKAKVCLQSPSNACDAAHLCYYPFHGILPADLKPIHAAAWRWLTLVQHPFNLAHRMQVSSGGEFFGPLVCYCEENRDQLASRGLEVIQEPAQLLLWPVLLEKFFTEQDDSNLCGAHGCFK